MSKRFIVLNTEEVRNDIMFSTFDLQTYNTPRRTEYLTPNQLQSAPVGLYEGPTKTMAEGRGRGPVHPWFISRASTRPNRKASASVTWEDWILSISI